MNEVSSRHMTSGLCVLNFVSYYFNQSKNDLKFYFDLIGEYERRNVSPSNLNFDSQTIVLFFLNRNVTLDRPSPSSMHRPSKMHTRRNATRAANASVQESLFSRIGLGSCETNHDMAQKRQELLHQIMTLPSQYIDGMLHIIHDQDMQVITRSSDWNINLNLHDMKKQTMDVLLQYITFVHQERFEMQVSVSCSMSTMSTSATQKNVPKIEKNHVIPTDKRTWFHCSNPNCTKRYEDVSNLHAHERTHVGTKPYVCHYDGCTSSFSHSSSLKEHLWKHAGIQPYQCPYPGCGRKFTQRSNCRRHEKLHYK